MSYSKTSWSDRIVQYPSRFTLVDNGDGTVTLTPAEGTITQTGTPLTASNLNHLENQYDQSIADANSYTDSKVSEHADRTDNPHQLTPEILGVYTKSEADVALETHSNRTDNPHLVSASQVGSYTKAESNANLSAHTNDLVKHITSAERTKWDAAQLTKITSDTGGVKLNITDPAKDLLTELISLGRGLHTFYSVANTINAPEPTASTRGIAFITSATGSPVFGFIMATTGTGNQYINVVNNDVWQGWRELVNKKDTGVQLSKITADNGAVQFSVSDPAKDFYAEVATWGLGLHSFYCISNAVNALPRSIRGLVHITNAVSLTGYVIAIDFTGDHFTNYVDAGVWQGWKEMLNTKDGGEIKNLVIENRTTDPTTPAVGQMWLRTDL